MAIENNVTCDACGKVSSAEVVRAANSRWMRVVPYAANGAGSVVIGRQSLKKKDFCSDECLAALAVTYVKAADIEQAKVKLTV